jgi:peptidoglycan hydrolase-like protein with peptidoglycan-binding domain
VRALALALSLLAAPALAQQQEGAAQQDTGTPQEAATPQERPAQQDGYAEFVKRVQIALHLHGFDPGPVNGADEGRTQAALAQFQLSRNLPASGSLDDRTLQALGVSREVPAMEEENASAGAGMPLAKP